MSGLAPGQGATVRAAAALGGILGTFQGVSPIDMLSSPTAMSAELSCGLFGKEGAFAAN